MERMPLTQAYQQKIDSAELRDDEAQRQLLPVFEQLYHQLIHPAKKLNLWQKLTGDIPRSVKNIYLWGDVGRGKSMLADLFFDALPDAIPHQHWHFHAFMTHIHEQLFEYRTRHSNARDALVPIANLFAKDCRFLYLDEFQVHDIADAMLLSRLLECLLERGVTILTTSNRPPDGLYEHGLQRAAFLPCIALIKQRFEVLSLNHPTDYRLEKMASQQVYFTPQDNIAQMEALFESLIQRPPHIAKLHVKGRDIILPRAADGCVWSDFNALCAQPLGSEDYHALAQQYHTLFLHGIPQMGPDHRNEAKRFTTLIDILYEHRTHLICAAETLPDHLYQRGDGSFEFARTASRLHEMQSALYLSIEHKS